MATSGRERAIETLIDMEPNGAFYRAARTMDEGVPQALASRPNLVTRAALVEQAHALGEYEIDSLPKYNQAFGGGSNSSQAKTAAAVQDEQHSERVLRHYSKILAVQKRNAPSGDSSSHHGPPPSLVALLRRLFQESTTSSDELAEPAVDSNEVLKSLLQAVTSHDAWSTDDDNDAAASLEAMICNISQQQQDVDENQHIHGLLIAALSILTGLVLHETNNNNEQTISITEEEPELVKKKKSHDNEHDMNDMDAVPRRVQVGSILSLMHPDTDSRGPFTLDPNILEYLGQAADVYEERIEIQKARLLQQMQASENIEEPPTAAIPIVPLSPTDGGGGNSPVNVELIPDDLAVEEEQHDLNDVDEAALSAAVFDRIISAVTGGEGEDEDDDDSVDAMDRAALRLAQAAAGLGADSSDDDNDSDSSDSDVLNDDDDSDSSSPPLMSRRHDSSSSSSSSSESEDDEDEHLEDMYVGGDDDEEDDMLQEALALSLATHGLHDAENDEDAGSNDQGSQNDNDGQGFSLEEAPEDAAGPEQDSPVPNNEAEEEDLALPPLPEPPSHYPYANLLLDSSTTEVDLDQGDRKGSATTIDPFVDPSALSRFGTVPASYTMVHMLRTALGATRGQREVEEEQGEGASQETNVIPGGMGCTLFAAQPTATEARLFMASKKKEMEEMDAVTLQLLLTTFVVMCESRNQAIEGLKQAILEEQRYAHGDEEEKDDESPSTPLSEEEDDPALALAITNSALASSDPSSSTVTHESLETKGMHRKAAAAADDAANRLKTLRKKKDDWKEKIKLYSHCTFIALRCIKGHLQGLVSRWLKTHTGDSTSLSAVSCHRFLPSSIGVQLSFFLDSLMSVSEFQSFATLISDDEGELVEDVLMSLKLYREAVSTWGDCVPLLYPTQAARSEILRSLILECFHKPSEFLPDFVSVRSLEELPSSDFEQHMHRLHILCRRLCVTDLLGDFVPRPLCYTPEEEDVDETAEALFFDELEDEQEPNGGSSIVALLGSSCSTLSTRQSGYVGRLHLALCHRLNLKGIMWDGLYAVSEHDGGDVVVSSSSSAPESVRVSSIPSSNLAFDSLKCSDSIAIVWNPADMQSVANGSAVNQRASKVWGTVLSSSFFSPKTGVHRWAIRLDKCERGHVFVGVATSQASTRTYVGGDKYGWGVIGTQALWHDRRKIRGDYGATFRTGSTIVVTLDTDAGTLSFGSWKDACGTSNSFSLDPLLPSFSSARRQSQSGGGTLEDWGIAFEGLPLDAKLFPAVGLYQRDDKVTLLPVDRGGRTSGHVHGESSGGSCYFPRLDEPDSLLDDESPMIYRIQKVRRHNRLLSEEAVEYVADTLEGITNTLIASKDLDENSLATIPSIAAAVCLLPSSIPLLSQKVALSLVSPVSRCIQALDQVSEGSCLFQHGLKEGKWVIRATGASGISSGDYEEYVVDFSTLFGGDGKKVGIRGSGVGTTGKSKNGIVLITGSVGGSALHFIEEWKDANDEVDSMLVDEASSSCFVAARLSIDGDKFQGTYRNVQYGSTGHIAGVLISDANPDQQGSSAALTCQSLLCLAHGHLASILAEDAAGDHATRFRDGIDMERVAVQRKFLANGLLAAGLKGPWNGRTTKALASLRAFYSCDTQGRGGSELLGVASFDDAGSPSTVSQELSLAEKVAAVDASIARVSGGTGSLSVLCPSDFARARQEVICALLYHGHLATQLDQFQTGAALDENDNLILAWRSALKVVEDGLRSALSAADRKDRSRKEHAVEFCQRAYKVASFLLDVEANPETRGLPIENIQQVASFIAHTPSDSDLEILREEMDSAMKRACLRLVAFRQVAALLPHPDEKAPSVVSNAAALECLASNLPRLLGRAFRKSRSEGFDLGGHFSAKLSGADLAILHKLSSSVHRVVQGLVHVLREALSGDEVESQSLFLSILPAFITTVHGGDIAGMIHESGVLQELCSLLDKYRESLRSTQVDIEKVFNDKVYLAGKLHQISYHDTSRSILRSVVSAAHVLTFQLTQCMSLPNAPDLLASDSTQCVQIVLDELRQTFLLAKELMELSLSKYSAQQADEDYHVCLHASLPGNSKSADLKKRLSQQVASRSGILRLLEGGTFATPVPLPVKPSASKSASGGNNSSTADGSGTGPARADDRLDLLEPHVHQYCSHWLHIVSCLLQNIVMSTIIVANEMNLNTLLSSVGLGGNHADLGATSMDIRDDKRLEVPGRYRARILRLMHGPLSRLEPRDDIIKSLFSIAGESHAMFTSDVSNDDTLVSKEAVSLLRVLHSPEHPSWRNSIQSAITDLMETKVPGSYLPPAALGVCTFISGSIEAIHGGSLVLLKPAVAASLSSETQSSPGSKSHGSSSTGGSASSSGIASHHIVGNGTEGIVAGLSRNQASAGIVSSIDMKSGMCEVILMERQSLPMSSLGSTNRTQGPALTVRALRTPLSEVAMAREFPLFLDETFPLSAMLGAWLESAVDCVSGKVEEQERTPSNTVGQVKKNVAQPLFSLMLLRSAIVLFSNEPLLLSFLKDGNSQGTLSRLLILANSSIKKMADERSPQLESVSSIPLREARHSVLLSMLDELQLRMNVLETTSDSVWEKRRDLFSLQARSEVSSGGPADSKKKGTSTTEATIGSEGQERLSSRNNVERNVSQSSSANSTEDEDESEAAATAAAHLREAAIAQMAELGLPRSWSELALRRTGGTNIEAAVHFCLERGGDMERLLAEERERERSAQRQSSGGSSSRRRGSRDESRSEHLLRQLLEMGFPSRWCTEALAASRNNVDEALTWILTNGERLSAEDEGMEEDDESGDIDEEEDDDDSGDDDDEDASQVQENAESARNIDEGTNVESEEGGHEETSGAANESSSPLDDEDGIIAKSTAVGWSGSVAPIRFISGKSTIDPQTLAISGLPSGGFSSVGTKGVLLTTGKWYYEAILETAGCLQIGWADGSFSGHCHADRGDGCGDGPSSWAYDGWRRYRWHATATEWGCRWKEGDVVGCLVDMDEKVVTFTLNGRGEEIGMGLAFSGKGFRPCSGVYACVSFNRREKLRIILGGKGTEPFKHKPPPGYRGVGEAVLAAVKEREDLLEKEKILFSDDIDSDWRAGSGASRRFLCDFSDGEHGHELFAWQHRYYGSDASVHLGSGRAGKQSSMNPKNAVGGSASPESSVMASVTNLLEEQWSGVSEEIGEDDEDNDSQHQDPSTLKLKMKQGFESVISPLENQLSQENDALAVLYSRKMILHLIVSLRDSFDLSHFVCDCSEPAREQLDVARKLWGVLDVSVNLHSAGWGGEAGAMAIAAEALGLGISSADNSSRSHVLDTTGSTSSLQKGGSLPVPVVGLSQLLSTVVVSRKIEHVSTNAKDAGSSFAACAEASIGADGGGGPLIFLQRGLQSAAIRSPQFCEVLVAIVRRSVRLLAVVDYGGDDSSSSDDYDDDTDNGSSASLDPVINRPSESKEDGAYQKLQLPDARLTCFLSGLLLSAPVRDAITNNTWVMESLVEAWSVGLLSASAPWRMVCALTVSGILNLAPASLSGAVQSIPTLARLYSRLPSTVARRIWAERAAVPVCSRYAQSLVELLACVKRSVCASPPVCPFLSTWDHVSVDAATPVPLCIPMYSEPAKKLIGINKHLSNWEWDEGWVSSHSSWDVWGGTVQFAAVDWKAPSRSAVRTLMDGGEGPPMLREGCTVMRGLDWQNDGSGSAQGNEDGKEQYELDKAEREKEKRELEEQAAAAEVENPAISSASVDDDDQEPVPESPPAAKAGEETPKTGDDQTPDAGKEQSETPSPAKKKKKKRLPNPKLPIGTVVSIEQWDGVPSAARRVRWKLTGKEGIYRYGGDGGRYDISHVEVNDKCTRVRRRHPLPESAEQCASRHGFGSKKKYSVLLRLCGDNMTETSNEGENCVREGLLELPDFGAGIHVECTCHSDGTVSIVEKALVYGAQDSGWEARFGHPSYVPGSVMVLSPTGTMTAQSQSDTDTKSSFRSSFQKLAGSSSFLVDSLRNRADGKKVKVISEMRLLRERKSEKTDSELCALHEYSSASGLPPLRFDKDFHASSLSRSYDGRTITCISADGRGTAFAATGFAKGVHYWEVKLEQADIGSVYIGVAEKPSGSGSGSAFGSDSPRLNRWLGWGFVNFRATYTSGAERVYGAHCHNDDTVGVLLDCDAGRISFFYDGLKYGEHILNDLGCAFENVSPFGFNADGCGSGGAGQGAPSGTDGGRGGRYPAHGAVKPRTLWPVIGLRNPGDRVTFSAKWMTSPGLDGVTTLRNVLAVDEILSKYEALQKEPSQPEQDAGFPEWFVEESFVEYQRWMSGRWYRTVTRGSGPYRLASFGLDVDLDCSPVACAAACAGLGLRQALLPGDRVAVKRSAGRLLELAEEALILGAHRGRLFYRLVSQKSEGGSLTEGGGRAWFWDESEVVDDSLQLVGEGRGLGVNLPLIDRFKCLSKGGLRIVYEGGAVVRSDLEIFDRSESIGSLPVDTVIPKSDVLERRVNSCGIVRYRVRHETIGEGWISSRIRGGKEEIIVEPVHDDDKSASSDGAARLTVPLDAALIWYEDYQKAGGIPAQSNDEWKIDNLEEFKTLLSNGIPKNVSLGRFDALISSLVSAIADNTEEGDAVECSFRETVSALNYALVSATNEQVSHESSGNMVANQAAAAVLAGEHQIQLSSTRAVLARMALLRALNRRARFALPWFCVRPSQEGTAILGGLCGHGASAERVGRNNRSQSMSLWVQAPSIAMRIRSNRGLLFTSVKRSFIDAVTNATTSPTPLSHDEYELPREIRTVRVNRLKARRAMHGSDNAAKRKFSVFSQLQIETRNWGGAALRRGFVAKGHGGQKRAFKVKLIGEGVNDYSGPYREVFTDALLEIVEHENGHGVLAVLDPTPNNASQLGDNRELFMFSMGDRQVDVTAEESDISDEEARIRKSFSIVTLKQDESSREVAESLVFLGRLVGTACRHGIPVDLPLPLGSVWRALTEEGTTLKETLQEIDLLASRQETRDVVPLLLWQQRMLNSFVDGMSNILPVETFSLLTGNELRAMLCGNPIVDVDLLKRVTEYEGYDQDDAVVEYFWDALREMTDDQRKRFLQFVWARNRLPNKESDFEAPFKIQKDATDNPDATLPSASTCFFSLMLPAYSSRKVLEEKLLFAIDNVCTMETDYVTNEAEVGEGWRGL